MEKRGDHAVVLGASMGGLLAARVLADFYDRVTVVERDRLSADPVDRRGVPQSRLIHAIQARGIQILDELFPGFVDELTAMGVESWEGDLSTLHFAFGGHQTVCSGRAPHLPVILCPSRPVLEWNVRRRVKAITNVVFLEGRDVVGLTATPDRDRVTGAWVTDRATDRKRTLRADLVVDATGRGSRTPVFLEKLGYGRPPHPQTQTQKGKFLAGVHIPSPSGPSISRFSMPRKAATERTWAAARFSSRTSLISFRFTATDFGAVMPILMRDGPI